MVHMPGARNPEELPHFGTETSTILGCLSGKSGTKALIGSDFPGRGRRPARELTLVLDRHLHQVRAKHDGTRVVASDIRGDGLDRPRGSRTEVGEDELPHP